MPNRVRVECFFSDGCPAAEPTSAMVEAVLEQTGVEAKVSTTVVADEQAAEQYRFLGSPTVRVNGRDVEPDVENRLDFGLG